MILPLKPEVSSLNLTSTKRLREHCKHLLEWNFVRIPSIHWTRTKKIDLLPLRQKETDSDLVQNATFLVLPLCIQVQVANNVILSIFNIAESINSGTQLLCKAEIECSAHHSVFCHMVYRIAYQIMLHTDPIFKPGIVSNFLTVISGLKILHERKQRLYNVI